ncbi:WXG100 family type VII secretion target [Nocardia farcinica]|uniref:WXG100 family type VII secretion target n=1 Tax=Nocardia farcinica TaxID=37329 RepID=UPI001893354E|nr:WXG100 family type VII secretion target [Nocardia farcinica]MBF6189033.1 WXG100 family type VII secretion target [Nocardia farcinica]MBF6410786.1 WXG100 family type VII secretion target [Nocardia farcinica]
MSHSVDLDLLDSVIARMKGFEEFFAEQITAFDTAISQLQTRWEGSAAAAQAEAHRRLMDAAREIGDGVADMRAAAEAAHTNYTQAIAANVAMWRS